MRYKFYDSKKYKEGQSRKTILAWRAGYYRHTLAEIQLRKCKRPECEIEFKIKKYYPKQFCSQRCSATFNNLIRGNLTEDWKKNISLALKGRKLGRRKPVALPLKKNCITCKKKFITPRWQNHRYCSVACSISDIGKRPTSPKAARAKSGIRFDIDPSLYFFSRWEANFARIMNMLKIKWIFQPKSFDLKFQRYTPDFYLPDFNEYVEIKNFLSEYSLKRDKAFRNLYPNIELILVLKEDYLKLQEQFAPLIKNWEFS